MGAYWRGSNKIQLLGSSYALIDDGYGANLARNSGGFLFAYGCEYLPVVFIADQNRSSSRSANILVRGFDRCNYLACYYVGVYHSFG